MEDRMFALGKNNEKFAAFLGNGIGRDFNTLTNRDLLERVCIFVMKNNSFAKGFGDRVKMKFSYLSENIQMRILQLAENNERFKKEFSEEGSIFQKY